MIWSMLFLYKLLASFHFRDMQDYKNDYNRAFGYKQEAVNSQIDGTAQDLELFLELLLISSDANFPLVISAARSLQSKLQITRMCVDIELKVLRPTDYGTYDHLPENPILPLTETCIQSRDNIQSLELLVNKTLLNLEQIFNTSSFEVFRYNLTDFSLEQLLEALYNFSSTFPLCYGEYKRRLDILIDLQKSLTVIDNQDTVMDISFELDIDVRMCIFVQLPYLFCLE